MQAARGGDIKKYLSDSRATEKVDERGTRRQRR